MGEEEEDVKVAEKTPYASGSYYLHQEFDFD